MLEFPRSTLVGDDWELVLGHVVLSRSHRFRVDHRLGIRLRHVGHQLGERERDASNVVVSGKLVPIEHRKIDLEVGLVSMNVEQELLIPDWVERVSDDTSTEHFLAERNHAEGIHVPTCSSH